jgi:hypothetical protein
MNSVGGLVLEIACLHTRYTQHPTPNTQHLTDTFGFFGPILRQDNISQICFRRIVGNLEAHVLTPNFSGRRRNAEELHRL